MVSILIKTPVLAGDHLPWEESSMGNERRRPLPKHEEFLEPHNPESPGLGRKNPFKKNTPQNPDDCDFDAIPIPQVH